MIETFLIGTYTHKSSEGVYELQLDTEKQQLQNLELVGRAGNPTYVAESKAHRVYAIDAESEDGKKIGGLKVFDASEKPFKELSKSLVAGPNPAYVAVDEDRQLVFTANYHTGVITVYKINADGTLTTTDTVKHTGAVGPAPEQQDGPHPHYTDLTPDNRLVCCDLGEDRVYLYDVSDAGKLTEKSQFKCAAGFGPRHIVFNTAQNVAYLVGELGSGIEVLDYISQAGEFTLRQELSTIPEDWTAHNGAAAIRLSSDNKFVYVSNRGYNSIATFKVEDNGELSLVDQISSEGDFPRDFNFNADESFIILVNQNTDNATLYSRDSATGKLTQVQKDFKVPEGVCVAFVK
ncbi:lactonase family protein [Lactobacillus sp. LC28-10]|uniref:Lactonase family protein n=1 Tax=Secundilactobacillus angelensis TaxID=2722706 RepID=A0ABX1KW70_9LACO|nr:lactonase family protein [Secundilactobacillus angelensis]MCH5462367.1 lactonase family protein [Secundilactobacillus angelensis]NLR18151.1 lactonase family protein [Secundilactobacillus angelensis]